MTAACTIWFDWIQCNDLQMVSFHFLFLLFNCWIELITYGIDICDQDEAMECLLCFLLFD